jgi:hypothetical protein
MDNLARAIDSYERRLPPDYDSSSISVGTAPSSTAEWQYLEDSDIKPHFMWRIISADNNKLYTSFHPISVRVSKQGNFFFAENDQLGLCGTGFNVQDATEDLGQHIIYFFNYYKSLSDDQLVGEAIRLKKLYSTLLLEEYAS